MKIQKSNDYLAIINGPEDGTEFALITTPVFVGSDATCEANIRLDHTVQGVHARLTPVSKGYRVRSAGSAPVYVDGRRVGVVRSRKLQSGGSLKVGHTSLLLECGNNGLAANSSHSGVGDDIAWALKTVGERALATAGSLLRKGRGKFIFAAVVLLLLAVPSARHAALNVLGDLVRMLRELLTNVFN